MQAIQLSLISEGGNPKKEHRSFRRLANQLLRGLDCPRKPAVIVVKEKHIRRFRLGNTTVARCAYARIRLLKQMDSRPTAFTCKLAHQHRTAVSRAIVHYHHDQPLSRRLHKGFQAALKILSSVISCDHDRIVKI